MADRLAQNAWPLTAAKEKSILPKLEVGHAMRRHVGMLAGGRTSRIKLDPTGF